MWPVRSSAVWKGLYVAHIFHPLGTVLLQRGAVRIGCGTGTRAGSAGVAGAVAGGLFVQCWAVGVGWSAGRGRARSGCIGTAIVCVLLVQGWPVGIGSGIGSRG